MKRILVLSLILTALFKPVAAQQKIQIAFIASPQLSWLSTDSKNIDKDGTRIGFGYGVEGDIFFGENYAITTGLTVSSLGGKLLYRPGEDFTFNGEVLPAGTGVEYYLTNLEVPLALKLVSRDFHRTRFFAQFGFTQWFNIKANGSSSDGTFDKDNIRNELNLYNLGLNVGGGLLYDLGKKNYLTTGLVYSNGFTDATSNRDLKDDVYLKSLRLRVGFVF